MKIQFINHSCFIVEKSDTKIICDPWIEDRVFDNGWDLIVKTPFQYEDFKDITHIWFSHEHPDHFFPPNIKKIPEHYRNKITVLFQYTKDKRVVNFCKKAGFKEIVELRANIWTSIGEDLKVMCENYTEGDSWLALQSNELTILNTNDCEVNNNKDVKNILHKIGGKVDVLLAQFSYACWAGNVEQTLLRKSIAKQKLDIFLLQIKEFKPKAAIPIASYVWFCHQENFYLNDLVNKPQQVLDIAMELNFTQTIILFPGEKYRLGETHDNPNSVKLWNQAYLKILSIDENQLEKSKTITQKQLLTDGGVFVSNLKSDFGWLTKFLKSTCVYIIDLNEAYKLSISNGLSLINKNKEDCDVSLSSESFYFCLKFPYGNDTLGVNGRYQRPPNGIYSKYYNFFRFNQLKSRGIKVNAIYLLKTLFRKIFGIASKA